ncbi:MAG: hypothetical protein ABH843_02315 [Candidatus Omnitrophota bacterium]
MVLLKIEKPHIRNVDLLNTYYSGKMTPAESRKPIAEPKNTFSPKLLLIVATTLIFLAGVVIIGYSLPAKEASRPEIINVGKTKLQIPSKNITNAPSYNYEYVKKSIASIALGGENSFAAISLGETMDLSNATISFGAKGESGSEKLALILRDAKNMSNANPDDIILTTALLKDKWHFFSVNLKDLNVPIDKSKITQIRFDNSPRLTKNYPGAKIYVKDINIK